MTQLEVFNILQAKIIEVQKRKHTVVRVGINGIEGTGKTTFCQSLTEFLNKKGLKAIQITIDGYHNPQQVRYKQGRDSAKGYYEDAYNETEFIEKVLISSQKENPTYVDAIHNLETDQPLKPTTLSLTNKHIILTDGAYIFKKNYAPYWDLKIYLQTDFETALARGIQRDLILLGGLTSAKEKYKVRYHKASKMYIEENNPTTVADIIIDNTEFNNLKIVIN